MTLHDDDAEHFEFFLKFMYTHHYDKDAIAKLAAEDKNRRVSIPSEIHAVADKYDMPLLLEPIAKDVEELLAGEVPCTLHLLQSRHTTRQCRTWAALWERSSCRRFRPSTTVSLVPINLPA
jgi:hypothetical protein